MNKLRLRFLLAVLVVAIGLMGDRPLAIAARPDGQLELRAVDSQSKQPLPVRIELAQGRASRPVLLRDLGVGHLGSHFYLPPAPTLLLRRGNYTFTLDAGAEYRTQQGRFEIDRHASDVEQVEMRRFADLAQEGWWGGDVHAERPGDELPLMAAVEGLHLAANVAWRFDGTKWKRADSKVRRPAAADDPYVAGRELQPCAAIFESPGGDLLLVGDQPLDRPPFELAAGTTSCQCLAVARREGFRVVPLSPTAWDLPLWIATGEIDAIAILSSQSQWKAAFDEDPKGRPRDTRFYPDGPGLTRWGIHIYHELLEAGFKTAPVAASGSGPTESPLGTNRAYAHLEGDFSAEAWWEAVEEGRVVVTNGPLLRPRVGGDPPGTTFLVTPGEPIEFEIALNLATRDNVEYLEILKNGEPLHEVRLSDLAAAKGKLPPVPFDQPGWFAVRAASTESRRYQFAESGPYYVATSDGPRISRESVDFFLAWLEDLAKLPPQPGGCTAGEIEAAKEFWLQRRAAATAP